MGSELRVRRILQDRQWSVSAARAFLDRDEGKSREIDIHATRVEGRKHNDRHCIHTEFKIFAEVKKTEKPWVVFRQYPLSSLGYCAWNNLINYIHLPCAPGSLASTLGNYSPIRSVGWEGSGIHQAFSKPDQPSRWYSAFLSALKAADDYAVEYETEGEARTTDMLKEPCELTFMQPLVVLDGVLVSAEIDTAGDVMIEEVSIAPFRFEYRTREYKQGSYRVGLVTLDGLPTYLDLLEQRQSALVDAIFRAAELK